MRYTIARCCECKYWPYFVLDNEDPWKHGRLKHGELFAFPDGSAPSLPPVEQPSAQLHNLQKEKRVREAPSEARDTTRPPDLSVLRKIKEDSA